MNGWNELVRMAVGVGVGVEAGGVNHFWAVNERLVEISFLIFQNETRQKSLYSYQSVTRQYTIVLTVYTMTAEYNSKWSPTYEYWIILLI